MAALSRERAREVIADIRIDNGGITPEDREKTPERVLRTVAMLRRKTAAATRTLATNLYSKDTRFVFELIQNAEDNKYSETSSEGVEPYLSFSLYPDRLVIDSNEDGFTEADVQAICSTGESTKSASGYIGEKGIGFKSVFKVAKRVQIQSGPFSFHFEYTRESDDGMGMVIPLDSDFDDLPDGVCTRMTLTLLRDTDFPQRRNDLMNIPDTFLLFLNKLKRLTVKIYPASGSEETIIHQHYPGARGSRSRISKSVQDRELAEVEHENRYYHVITRAVQGLPDDEARKNNDKATVVLAFPVNEGDAPIVEEQYVYAFLPLRQVGFTFLIQSDFVTQASREDVFSSDRNTKLLSHVAEAFRDAVLRFCQHPTLQYQWMRWLPKDSISDEFWKQLGPQLITRLQSTRILRTRSEATLHLPSELCVLGSDWVDADGDPLCDDIQPEIYLSKKYKGTDVTILKTRLQVRRLHMSEVVDRVKADLLSSRSKIKSSTSADWHSRLANILCKHANPSSSPRLAEQIQSLQIIPLQDGRWLSSKFNPIYFQQGGRVEIPTDLGLKLVDQTASANSARKELFRALGVETATTQAITSLISKRYRAGSLGQSDVSLDHSVSHLAYIFFHPIKNHANVDPDVWVFDHNIRLVNRRGPFMKNIYFEKANDNYAPKQLFPARSTVPNSFEPSYLHVRYVSRFDADTNVHGKSWMNWLRDHVGIHWTVQLLSPSSPERTSDEFEFVLKYRADVLPGLLQRNWTEYEHQITSDIRTAIGLTEVPTGSGSKLKLKDTFLPLPTLRAEAQFFGVGNFSFLHLPTTLTAENCTDWIFLEHVGVKTNINLLFYRVMLWCLARGRPGSVNQTVLPTLYTRLGDQCTNAELVKCARRDFADDKWLYLPRSGDNAGTWVKSGNCVWAAPDWFDMKHCLARLDLYQSLRGFCTITLMLPDATWKDFLSQLERMKAQGACRIDILSDLYRRLWNEFRNDEDPEALRREFEDSKLVYIPRTNTWLPPSACLWVNDKIRISGKASIAKDYASLEEFFTESLKVAKPEISTYVEELKSAAGDVNRVNEIKGLMKHIISMNPKASGLQSIQRSPIFPVRLPDGQLSLSNTEADFAIADRQEHYDAFHSMAMGLGKKYTSRTVQEQTSVAGSRSDHILTEFFRQRAYAVFRCGFQYHSPKCRDDDHALYDQLLHANVYISDGITKSITLYQYGRPYTVECAKSTLHFEEADGGLRIYVPRRKSDRQFCFARELPNRLLRYLIVKDDKAETVMVNILQNASLSVVDAILLDSGIVEVDGISRPVDYESDEESELASTILTPAATPAVSPARSVGITTAGAREPSPIPQTSRPAAVAVTAQTSIPEPATRPSAVVANARRESAATFATSNTLPVPSSTPEAPIAPMFQSRDSLAHPTAYITVLDRMIKFGELCDDLPNRGEAVTFDLSRSGSWYESLVSDAGFNVRSLERDKRVGAAGELLMFELLKNVLRLSGFDFTAWKSTVRSFVSVHPRYVDLTSWTGSETADIVYSDILSEFTAWLISTGYLENDVWSGATPTYYIEVKTTTRNCDEAFYMSDSQYRRMQNYRLEPDRRSQNVYLLARVFGIASKEVGLRIYVDPETARRNGELQFSVDTWKVNTAN